MTYNELIAEINAKIKTNGEGEITGSILNEVLTDIVDTLAERTPLSGAVQVIISDSDTSATFLWPYEDTPLNELAIEGYNGAALNDPFPKNGMRISKGGTYSEYVSGAWYGGISQLVKNEWYTFSYANAATSNNMVLIKKQI